MTIARGHASLLAFVALALAPVGAARAQDHDTAQTHEHAGHDASATTDDERDAPDDAVSPIPELTDADRAAAFAPAGGHEAHDMHDEDIHSLVVFDHLETWNGDDGDGVAWDAQAWIGTDLDRLWLRSEGERVGGDVEHADVEVMYGHSVAPWWDLVVGVRHDIVPGSDADYAAIGVIGVAPYKFEVEATAYVGAAGRTAVRVDVEYSTLLTNRLILQPMLEINAHGSDDERRGIGSGLGTVEAGLRLRYEVTRRFAPYVGIVRERAFGRTAGFRRAAGEDVDDTRVVAGVRVWF